MFQFLRALSAVPEGVAPDPTGQAGGEPLGGIVARRATIKSRNPDFRQKRFGF